MSSRTLAACVAAFLCCQGACAVDLTIASVKNGQMLRMQELTHHFEAAHPDIKVNWQVMDENVLRDRVTADVAANAGQYDVMTIGMYETPIWAQKGWIRPLEFDLPYRAGDLLPAIRSGLSWQGKLYAAPFYGESSMLMVRSDLLERAGVTLDEHPTWNQVRDAAARLNDPAQGVAGICLRGKPGWGDNMALVTTMANAFGGQWFDMDWKPRLTSPEWKAAVEFYVDLITKYGPPGSVNNSFNEILALYKDGKCAMWLDATIAASFLADPKQSAVASRVAFVQAPSAATGKGANWLWAWALAIPADTQKAQAAQQFVSWATSKEYIQLVAASYGWASVPTGTRKSTYLSREFRRSSRFASAEQKAIFSAHPEDPTLPKSPYVGIQFAAIPEFSEIAGITAENVAKALEGRQSVDDALRISQAAAEERLRASGRLH